MESGASDKASADVDIYRDTPVRLLGYANEVGESFRVWISRGWVRATYGVSAAYVLADTADKANKQIDKNKTIGDGSSATVWSRSVLLSAVDSLIWQSLASVILPGITINRLCCFVLLTLRRYSSLCATRRKYFTTASGLLCIPLIVKPIDHYVDLFMDATLRRYTSPKTD